MKKFFTVLTLSVMTQAAIAAGDAHGTTNWHMLFKDFGYRVLVFAVFVFILVKLLKQPILNFLDKRTREIEKSIQSAKEANEKAKLEIESYKSKMQDYEKDLELMKERAKAAAELEKNEIIADAERQIEKISKLAESRIEADFTKASVELRKQAVIAALDVAQTKLGKELSPEKQNEIVNTYINRLGVTK